MAIDIKVIPTLHGDEAMRFINNADDVMKSKERVDFFRENSYSSCYI